MAPTEQATMNLTSADTFPAVLPNPAEPTRLQSHSGGAALRTAAPTPLTVLSELLSGRDELEARLQSMPNDGTQLIITLVGLAATGSCIFGAANGVNGGAMAMALSAAKLTLTATATIAMSAPALSATRRVLTGDGNLTRELVRLLAMFARAGIVLAALAPLVLLAVSWELTPTYQHMLAFACCGVAGARAASLLSLGTRDLSRSQRYTLGTSGALTIALLWFQVTATLNLFV